MARVTGVGSHPGEDQHAYDEAVRLVLGELPDLAYVPEVPGRGAGASMTGRGVAVMAALGADLQPAGWRLTDAPGVDQRRARSLLAQDLDGFEEQAQGYAGTVKVQVAGPWTLAATVERPRGDKVLADFGARRDLAQALAEGLRDHVADLRRRVPKAAGIVVQVDEPALAAVLSAAIPTASGFGRHRAVHPPEASQALEWVLGAVTEVRSRAVGPHLRERDTRWTCCAARVRAASRSTWTGSPRATSTSSGERSRRGRPSRSASYRPPIPRSPMTDAQVTESVVRWLDMLGQDPDAVGDRLVLTPACGLAGASPAWTQQSLALLRAAADHLSG